MVWSHWIVDTQSGVKQLQVTPATGSFSRALNSSGQDGSFSFLLAASPLSKVQWKALTTPWARTIVQCWNGVPRYAGLIVDRPWDVDSQTLTVSTVDVRTILSNRYPFGVTGYWADEANHIPGNLICSSLEYQSIVSMLMAASLTSLFPTSATLPIILPSSSVAGAQSRTYFNYNFMKTDAAVQEIQNAAGGPDTDFEQSWSGSGALQWTLRCGTDAAPTLTGNTFEWNMSGSTKTLTGVVLREDARKQVTGVYSIGAGSEQDMAVAGRGLGFAAAIPALDITQTFKSIDSQPVLAGHSSSELAVMSTTTKQWSLSVMADDPAWRGLEPQLGSLIRVYFKGDGFIDDGWQSLRLIGVSGDLTNKLTLSVQV